MPDATNDKYHMLRPRTNGLLQLLLCIFLVFSLLSVTSCSGGSRNNDTGTEQTTAGGGEYGPGGDGVTGGADAEEDDSPDDAYATMPANAYSPEIQTQLETFIDIAEQLPLDDIPSAAALLKAYRELAFDGPVNDELFFKYEEHMQFICEGLNSVYEEEPPDDGTINDATENGFLYIEENEYTAYFILRPDFLKYTFAESVSAKVQAFLNLLTKHYDFRNGYDFIENETLMITLDQLAEMIVDWENYIRVYPDVTNRSDIEQNLDFYLKIYIGSIQIENSGFYILAGTDENGETLYKLMDEPRQSYMKFIENYSDSAACPLIAELYQIYSDNNFLYSIDVENFFKAYGLAYDII